MEEAVMIPEIPQELITYIEENSATPEVDIQSVRDNVSKEIYKPFSPEKFYVQAYQILKKKKKISFCMLVLVVVLVTTALFIIPKDSILFNILSGILLFISLPIAVVGGYLFYCVNNVEKRIEDYEMSSARGLLTFEAAQKLYETLENLKKAPLISEMIEIQNLFYSLRLCTPFEYNFVNNQVEIQSKLNLSILECETKIKNVNQNLQNTTSEIEKIQNKISLLKESQLLLPDKKVQYEVENRNFQNLGSVQKIIELENEIKLKEEEYKNRIEKMLEEEKQVLSEQKNDEENIVKNNKLIEEYEAQIRKLESDYEFELVQKKNKYNEAEEYYTTLNKQAKEKDFKIKTELNHVEYDIEKVQRDINFIKEPIELNQLKLQFDTLSEKKKLLLEEKNNLFSPYSDIEKAKEEVEKVQKDYQEIESSKNQRINQPKAEIMLQISQIQNTNIDLKNKNLSNENNLKSLKNVKENEVNKYQSSIGFVTDTLEKLKLTQNNITKLEREIEFLENELENLSTIEERESELYTMKEKLSSESEILYLEHSNLLSLKTGSEEAIKKVIAIYS